MRRSHPTDEPVTLTIAGSDSGGGAGIQADLTTIAACGGYPTSAITAVTAQHTRGVERSFPLPLEEVTAQIDAVLDDFNVAAAKTGMLATAEIIEVVADRFADSDVPLVVDPVMVAASGDRLLDETAESAYDRLIELAAVVTPNVDEAEVLADVTITDEESASDAGRRILEIGPDAVLVTGGHLEGETVTDLLVTREGVNRIEHPRIDSDATHGSGCTLSAAIATSLAHGSTLSAAVESSTDLLARSIRYHYDVGHGPGAVNHVVEVRNQGWRTAVLDEVNQVVDRLIDINVTPLVPEVGMNVVGATPFAESIDDTAAVDGRITRVRGGVKPNGCVRFAASSHVARFLLTAREYHPELRFALNCRFDDDIDSALETSGLTVAEYDRSNEPDDTAEEEGTTMQWGARTVFETRDDRPEAVVDRGAHGKEPMTKLLASDPMTLCDLVADLLDAV